MPVVWYRPELDSSHSQSTKFYKTQKGAQMVDLFRSLILNGLIDRHFSGVMKFLISLARAEKRLASRSNLCRVGASIIRMLEEGVALWQKPWQATGATLNPTTGNAYRGGNAIHLMATPIRREFDDPRWMTYRQAAQNGWQVRRGEKADFR